LRKMAEDSAPRLHPNSAAMGFIITPMVSRPPEFRNRMTKEAARTYQP